MLRNEREFLDDLWCRSVGVKYTQRNENGLSYPELKKTQWYLKFEMIIRNNIYFVNENFLKLMKSRLIIGALRYGRKKKISDYSAFDYIPRYRDKIEEYSKTLNPELLVDLGNYNLLMFIQAEYKYGHVTEDFDINQNRNNPLSVFLMEFILHMNAFTKSKQEFKSLDNTHKRLDQY